MAKERKSIVDEALLESREIEKTFEANAKEILTRSMGSDIEQMVKENLENSNGLTEDDDEELELMVSDEMDDDNDDLDLNLGDEDDDLGLDLDDEEDDDIDFDIDLDDEEDDELDVDTDIETIDLTGASDSEVVTVFKKMGPEDEIEVVQTGDTIDIKDNQTGAEYRVELGGSDVDMEVDVDLNLDSDETEIDLDDFDSMETMDADDLGESVIYEIEIEDDEEEDEEDYDSDMSYMEDDEIEEASRTLGSGRKWGRKGLNKPTTAPRHLRQESTRPMNSKLLKENKVLKTNIKSVIKENEELKSDYNNMVDALKEFKNRLNEVAVFNSNLTYAVRLFTENSTTKDEKLEIIKRFDEAKSLKESKNTYKQLVKEFSTKKPIKESVEEKLNETKSSGSKAQINESSVYVNPEFEKMKKLWSYEYK